MDGGTATRRKKKSAPEKKPSESAASSRIHVEMVPLSKLMEWPGNPKEHDLDTIGESFERFGFIEPIVFDEKTKRIVAGHGRREKLLSWRDSGKPPPDRIEVRGKEWLVPVLRGVSFENAHEAEAYLLQSNQSVIRGGYNATALAAMLARHAKDAHGIGWREDEINDLVATAQKAAQGAYDEANAAPPADFREHDEGQRATHACPRCGFNVLCE